MGQATQLPIAVVGVSSLMPGSLDVEGFWRDIVAARDLITDVPPTHWLVDDYYDPNPAAPGKTYARRGAFIPDVQFDPTAFGLPPAVLPATDTSQLLALVAAERLLADVEAVGAIDARDRVSVILGSSALPLLGEMSMASGRPHWLKGLRESGVAETEAQQICDRIAENYVSWQENTFPGLLSNVVAGRIANRFDLGGTNCTVDAACASALAALSVAVGELTLGAADMVITGAVDTLNDHTTYQCFSKTHALSPTGDCRPFSGTADGTMLGEGVAMFALKRLEDAERDNNRIYAVIRGIGSSSDGRGTAIYAPLPEGQVAALRRAYRVAGYSPDTVGLVEGHGTGTAAGDVAEVTALRQVFSAAGSEKQSCALGSVKSQIGHTKACAGGAGLLKAILALHHKTLPPTIKVDRPNPALELENSPFYLNTTVRPWVNDSSHPRRASVSSFGFGGTNFHVTVEEYLSTPEADRSAAPWMGAPPAELVLLSADSPAALLEKLEAVDVSVPIERMAKQSRRDFCVTDSARIAVVAADASELTEKLAIARTRCESPNGAPVPGSGVYCGLTAAEPGAVAFLFPGQGSQYVGMSADLAMNLPAVQRVWDSADVRDESGISLADVVFPVPAGSAVEREEQAARLTATEWAQPALAIHSLALLELLRTAQVQPGAVAGHSAGELTALHVGGAFDAHDLLKLARRRGELMRDVTADAAIRGAMLAVSADAASVAAAVKHIRDVWLVNYNAPKQVVLSGAEDAIAEADRAFTASGIATRRLRTATAFHSPLVADATAPLRKFLDEVEIHAPAIAVYGSVDAAQYPSDNDRIRDQIATQLCSPVRFVDQIEQMYRDGVRTFVEVGAGAALTTLVGKILKDRDHLVVSTDRHGRNGVRSFLEALGALAVGGVAHDLDALWTHFASDESAKEARTSKPKSKMQVTISGTNYGRPYPPAGGSAQLPPPNGPKSTEQPMNTPNKMQTDGDRAGWIGFFNEIQRQTAEAQALYQRTTAEVHAAYLRTTEASMTAASRMFGADLAQSLTMEPPVQHESTSYNAGLAHTNGHGSQSSTVDTAPTVAPDPDSVSLSTPLASPASEAESASDLETVLLSVVADKTGYPAEVLASDMDMEADLGIDSIKRVEILSAMREYVPALQQSAAGELTQLGSLRTLDDVLGKLRELDDLAEVSDLPAVQGEIVSDGTLTRFTVQAVMAPATGEAMPGVGLGRVAIADDGMGVAPRLVRELANRGIDATTVAPAGTFDNYDGVVFLGGLRPIGSIREALDIQREAFQVARAMAPRFASRPGVFVTVQHTGGSFGLDGIAPTRAWIGGLPGLSRTVQHEWPDVSVKAIDCGFDSVESIAVAVADELTGGGPEVDVGLRTTGRITLRTVSTELVPGSQNWLDTNPVIVVSGGARGITAAALCALAERYRCRLLLLGRSTFDEASAEDGTAREIAATLARLRAAGAEVRYRALDIREAGAVAQAITEVRQEWGPVTGLVHGAGVIADKLLVEKTIDQFDDVFSTKVGGLRALLEATSSDPLRLICMFSSVVGHYGNSGQSDYAMANATLTSVAAAEAASRPDCVVRSIAWGPWASGMVTGSVAELLQARGIPLIGREDGSRAFVAELEGPDNQVEVLLAATGIAGELPFRVADHRAAKVTR